VRTYIKKSSPKSLKAADTLALQRRPKRSRIGAENAREQTPKKALVQAVGRLVLVEWLDSYGCSSEWQSLESCDPAPMKCYSVGWLVGDTLDCKVIVPYLSEDGHPDIPIQGCGDMTIPTSAILNISDLSIHTKKRMRA